MTDAVIVEVPRDTAVLIGREPDPAKLPPHLKRIESGPPRTTVLPSAQVSGNHLLAEHRADGLFICDLNSRNGSWLRLAPGREVRLPAIDLTLDLARSSTSKALDEGPEDAEWTNVGSFAAGVLAAVTRWLRRRDIRATAALRDAEDGAGDAPAFGLADGSVLVVKPPSDATLTSGWLDRVRAYTHRQNAFFEHELGHDDSFVMASPAFRSAHRQVVEAALRGQRLVILGETGSGKDVLAQCYHRHSDPVRAKGPFQAVNCGGLTVIDLMPLELFGAKRGAYTGCVRDVPGAVEVADGGTLLLDEIGDMPMHAQVSLLRFLDKKGEYKRLGDPIVRHADVRIISATNKDLEALVEKKEFRADLWYRLNGDVLRVPPLSERPEDVLAFLNGREILPGLKAYDAMTQDAIALVLAQPWRGNFRELDNFVGRLVSVMSKGRCDAAACRRALRLKDDHTSSPVAPARLEQQVPRDVWRQIVERASGAWAEDSGGPMPTSWSSLERFQEQYVKPLFVAYMCNKHDPEQLAGELNYSKMARTLALSDGSRVKAYLTRYRERFLRPRDPLEQAGCEVVATNPAAGRSRAT